MRALVNTNHAAVINIDPSGLQVMINWKNGKQILSRPVSDALCDVAHRWTIYIAGICVRQDGAQYIKSIDIRPEGVHRVERLSDVLEHFYEGVKADCNPNQRIGMDWLALPASGITETCHGCSSERPVSKDRGEAKDSRRRGVADAYHGRNPPGSR
ncbi:hypothetical protein [Pseudomonas sp. T1.Ur]|uniref:hypothetical protein n=1 Tax=Pseudomonas sp. T1.Ur TaxID=2928704 RepID=UPI00201DBFB2|nr:hypothetical protein [Pseudomonas sp. T1.Ur]MCL6701296.1 hypothetical protein [Pseudomonas sp. T1.Ur]